MIEGGWPFVWVAYGITLGALAVLSVVVVARSLYWRWHAQELDRTKQERRA